MTAAQDHGVDQRLHVVVVGEDVRVDERRGGRIGRCPAQRQAQHRAVRALDLRQVVRRHLLRLEGDVVAPGQQPQLQPQSRRALRGQHALAEHGTAGHPALAYRGAGVQQFGGWHEAVVGMVPADVIVVSKKAAGPLPAVWRQCRTQVAQYVS